MKSEGADYKFKNFLCDDFLIQNINLGITIPEFKKFISNDHYKKVLIVENDSEKFQTLAKLLTEKNPNVKIDCADSSKNAFILINKTITIGDSALSYDLVISEVFLPEEESGVDIFNYCHLINPKIECVLLSTKVADQMQVKEFEAVNFNLLYHNLAPILTTSSMTDQLNRYS